MSTKLRIYGAIHEVNTPDGMPLLWVIRDELKLTGTKFGCGVASCGACTVHVNGEPGTPPAGPALANAISPFGLRATRLPLTAHNVSFA